jgi:8-oxo-dGTP pyrophosphatase MutT (NUDIX family)
MAKLSGDALAVKKLTVAIKATGLFGPEAIRMIKKGDVSDRKIVEAVEDFKKAMFPEDVPVKDRYVLGVAVDPDWTHMVVLEKKRPSWQAGKLNCPGGRVNPGETPHQAMVREFFEETGIKTDFDFADRDDVPTWRYVGVKKRDAITPLQDWSYRVDIFVIELPLGMLKTARCATDEIVSVIPIDIEVLRHRAVPGLAGLVDLALWSMEDGSLLTIEDPPHIEVTE